MCEGNVINDGFSISERSLRGDEFGEILVPTEYLEGEVRDGYCLTLDDDEAVEVNDDSLLFCN